MKMLYMIELHYSPEHRDSALSYFFEHGSTRYDGNVDLRQAWVATQDRIAYALVSSPDIDEVSKACSPLEAFGAVEFRHVTSMDVL